MSAALRSRPPAAARTCATTCPRSSRSARSATGAAPSASRAWSTQTLVVVPLPLLVPLRGRGDRARPGDRRRPARLQPRRRAAARRLDDRQGDPGGAPAAAPAAPDRRALLQGLSVLLHVRAPRSAASPPIRRTCTACSTTSSSSCSSSPRARRRPRSSTRTATGCAASAAAASSRRRCAPASRSSRSRSSAPRRRCRRSPRSALLKRLTGLIYFPITPLFPHLGLLGATYLPAKFKLRFLEPVPTGPHGRGAVGGQGRWCRRSPTTSARGSRTSWSTWSGSAALGVARMSGRRVLITGLSTYWGGRLAQALERDPDVEVIVGVSPERPDLRADPHRVRPRRHPARAAQADRRGGGRSTP